MKKKYNLNMLGSLPKWTTRLMLVMAFLWMAVGSAMAFPGYSITGSVSPLCQNATNTLTTNIGLSNSVVGDYYLLFREDASGNFLQVGLVINESGGPIQFGGYSIPGKYVVYNFGPVNPMGQPLTSTAGGVEQSGSIFIYAYPLAETASFPTGTCMSGSDGSFCAGTGVIEVTSEAPSVALGATWTTSYKLFDNTDAPYGSAVDGTGSTIQFTGVAAGTYHVKAKRSSCDYVTVSGTLTIVDDVTAPTWTTATSALDRTVECSDAQGLLDAQALYPEATDCHNANLDTKVAGSFVPGACGLSGTYTNTWTATDDCGNTSAVYTQIITVVDTQAPTWTTAASALDVTLECSDAAGLALAQAMRPEATDNCDLGVITGTKITTGSLVSSGCAPYTGTYTNTFTATDACGNTSATYTQIITIVDNTAPVFGEVSTALDRTVECSDASALAAAQLLAPTATDNCSTPTVVKTTSGSLNPGCGAYTGTITNEFTATDGCGNTSVYSQTITIVDTQKPTWVTLGTDLDVSVSCSDAAGLQAAQDARPVATDNCDLSLVVDKVPGTLTGGCSIYTGTIVNTFTVTDVCGNTSDVFTQTITVYDNSAPTWTVGATSLDRTVSCSDGAALDAAQNLSPSYTDNCGDLNNLVRTPGSFVASGCGALGNYTGTYTNTFSISDKCGNPSTIFTQVITVIDNEAPVVSTPANSLDHTGLNKISIADLTGIAAALAEAPSATDNCASTVTSNLISDETVYAGPCSPDEIRSYTRTRSWNFSDECGNTGSSFTQVIEVDASSPITSMSDAIVCDGYSFDVPVVVTKMTNVSAVSLTIQFDNTKMTYVNFTDVLSLNFSYSTTTVGNLTTIRFTSTPIPTNYPGGNLLVLHFSNLTGTASISFVNDYATDNEYAYPINSFESNPFCDSPASTYYVGCTITKKELPTVNAGTDYTICEDGSYTLDGSVGGGATTGVWSGGAGTFDPSATDLHATYTPTMAERTLGSVTLTLTTTDAAPCAEISDDMVLHLKKLPTVDAGTDHTICAGDVFETSGSVGGGASEVLWSTPNGTGTFDNPTSLVCVYTPSAADTTAGSVTITLSTTDASPCADIDNSITLTIKHKPTVSAGIDQTVCIDATSVALAATVGGGATEGIWTGGNGGTFDVPTSLTANYFPSASDKSAGFVTLTFTTTDALPCGDVSDDMTITFHPLPTSVKGDDQTVCADEATVTMTGYSYGGGATGGVWSGGAGSWAGDVYTPTAAEKTTSPYYLDLTYTTTGSSPCAEIEKTTRITFHQLPTSVKGDDQTVCADVTTVTMTGYSFGGGASGGVWSGGAGTWVGDVYTPTAGEKTTSPYTVELKYSTTGSSPCSEIDKFTTITFHQLPTAEAGPDQTICQTGLATMGGYSYTNATGATWSGGAGSWAGDVYTPAASEYGTTIQLTYTTNTADPCAEASDFMNLTIETTSTLSGYVKYNKVPTSVPMNKVSVKLKQGATEYGPVETDINGYYTITDICPGTYDVIITNPRPVNGAVNSTDAAQVNAWGNLLTPTAIEYVRFYAGDLVGAGVPGTSVNNRVTNLDAVQIAKFFTENGLNGPYSPRGLWTFWYASGTISSNPSAPGSPTLLVPTITAPAVGTALTQDFYGLVTGDFNRSFTPGVLTKTASESVTLNYNQTKQFNMAKEVELPIHVSSDVEVGAVSLVMDLPSNMDVTNVFIRGNNDQPVMYNVIGNELRISWYSLNPMKLQANDELLVIKLRANGNLAKGEVVKLELAAAQENELADGNYNAINHADLYIDMLKATATSVVENSVLDLALTSRPNPFKGNTTFSYNLPADGNVTIEINNVLGANIATLVNENQTSGTHTFNFDSDKLAPGVYTATLKFNSASTELVRTIKIVKNQ